MTFALAYPHLDPIALQLGPFAIRWYALAYIAGLMTGWRYVKFLVARPPNAMTEIEVDDFLVWATLGVVLGGRLGYVLFYKPLHYLANPLEIPMVWQGGMSFHGGALGVILGIIAFSRFRGRNLFLVGDVICCAVPIGLFFGRLANFVNGELFGRVAPDVEWAMVFPGGGPIPRHPSQLYEAGLEGVILFLIMFGLWKLTDIRYRAGALSGVFLAGYGLARITAEFFRQPDAHLGFLWGGATMGQLLSIPQVLVGLAMLVWAWRRGPRAKAAG
ncbi:prolipoprotein diacylglyceryl transferase [Magnetospirillum sp. 15-1]|uniref:prolipoprotein diacylglyceryl transferase n=1 Tax=Magnetospirillum sp. 15-1 TaxID=1979370 RepID=UPI000BBC560C|nr:prolipoprotein diacylglyceryl transferase [Magnetospirillum sp. 15-1]